MNVLKPAGEHTGKLGVPNQGWLGITSGSVTEASGSAHLPHVHAVRFSIFQNKFVLKRNLTSCMDVF